MQTQKLFGRYMIDVNLSNMPIAEEAQQRLDYQKANSLQEPPGGIYRSNNLSSQKTDDLQRYPT